MHHIFTFLTPDQIMTDLDIMTPYLTEWRGRYNGACAGILFPKTTQEVSLIVITAKKNKLKVRIQGGNTGLVGGQIPFDTQREIIISLKKMDHIRDYSPQDRGLIAQAGVVLQNIHLTLEKESLIFPMRLASSGSAQIGGLISTNAGGTNVLKYGTMCDLVYGLEAVMPNGDIIKDTHFLKKKNTGLSLLSLLGGTEGQYGIITAASLRLFPKPKSQNIFLISCSSLQKAQNIFYILQDSLGDMISEFELIPQIAFDFMHKHMPSCVIPIRPFPNWACLVEVSSFLPEEQIMSLIETIIEKAYHNHEIIDAHIAKNETQKLQLQQFRESLSACQKYEGASLKHDISVPIKHIPYFIEEGIKRIEQLIPDIRPFPFGHMGDGNIHFNFSIPLNMEKNVFLSHEKECNHILFDLAHELGGSFSAEHGIGRLRAEQFKNYSSKEMLSLVDHIKKGIDPENILNIQSSEET